MRGIVYHADHQSDWNVFLGLPSDLILAFLAVQRKWDQSNGLLSSRQSEVTLYISSEAKTRPSPPTESLAARPSRTPARHGRSADRSSAGSKHR